MTHRYSGPKDSNIKCAVPTILCSCGFESPGDSWRKAFGGFDEHRTREKSVDGETTGVADTTLATRADYRMAIILLLEGCATALAEDDIDAVGELANMIVHYADRIGSLPNDSPKP